MIALGLGYVTGLYFVRTRVIMILGITMMRAATCSSMIIDFLPYCFSLSVGPCAIVILYVENCNENQIYR